MVCEGGRKFPVLSFFPVGRQKTEGRKEVQCLSPIPRRDHRVTQQKISYRTSRKNLYFFVCFKTSFEENVSFFYRNSLVKKCGSKKEEAKRFSPSSFLFHCVVWQGG